MKLLIPLLLILALSGCSPQHRTEEEKLEANYPSVCIRGKMYLMARTYFRYNVPVYTGEPCKEQNQ